MGKENKYMQLGKIVRKRNLKDGKTRFYDKEGNYFDATEEHRETIEEIQGLVKQCKELVARAMKAKEESKDG